MLPGVDLGVTRGSLRCYQRLTWVLPEGDLGVTRKRQDISYLDSTEPRSAVGADIAVDGVSPQDEREEGLAAALAFLPVADAPSILSLLQYLWLFH